MTDALRRVARIAWSGYEYISMVLGLGCLAVLCLAWLPFAALLYALLPRRLGQPVGRLFIMVGFRVYLRFLTIFCGFRFDLTELDMLPRGQPVVLVANHPSLLDAVMIISRFPDMVCVMKAKLMANPLLGAAARLARYIPNNAPLDIILRGREALREGAHLLIFPEGTRTAHFPVDTCTASAGLIAQRAGVPVQSVLIECNLPYLGKAWPLWRRPELLQRFRVRLGRRFTPPRDLVAFAGELEAHFRTELARPSAQPDTTDLASAQEALS